MERIYHALDLSVPDLDYGRVHPAHGPYRPDSPHWKRFREALGMPELP